MSAPMVSMPFEHLSNSQNNKASEVFHLPPLGRSTTHSAPLEQTRILAPTYEASRRRRQKSDKTVPWQRGDTFPILENEFSLSQASERSIGRGIQRRGYWRPTPTGITDDDEEEDISSEDSFRPVQKRSLTSISTDHRRRAISKYSDSGSNDDSRSWSSHHHHHHHRVSSSHPLDPTVHNFDMLYDSSGESSSNPILYASNHNTSSPTFSSVLPCWSTSIFNHLTSRPPHSPPMSQSKLRSQDPSPLLSAGPNGGQRADLSTNPINGQSNSVQPNQNTDPTDLTGQPERLPGRRLRLLKFQGIFLLCFTMAVFLGMAFHHSKVRSIRPSLSIEGFESFLPISSGPLPRHINLGALIAVDLLMHGWGNSMTGPIRTSQNVSHHLMVPSGCDALMGTSFCGIYENLIDRSSCLSDRSESNALNCSIAYGLSLMNMAAPYQQFAALVLSWRQITPIVPPSCHFLLSLENHNTMKLQNDVIQLAFQHPKLQSLQQYFESPNYIIGPSSVNETHQRLLQTLNGVKLFSIGSSAPTGLMDNSIWFAQNAPLKNWFHLKSSTDLQCSISPSEAKEFPLESLRHSQICWEVDVGPFGSLGHPVKRQTEGTDSMSKAGEKWMLLLFRWSKGIVSPCYPFYPFLKWLLTSGAVYVAVVICWLHSLASPSPVTLVHFPRLVIYQFIMLYRVVVLYILGGFLETLTGPGFDFSDHIVLYMMLGLILCIECTAAERSHERIPVIVSKESYRRQFLGQEGPTEQKETIVGKSSSRLSKCSTGVANFVKLCLSSDSEDDDIRQPSNSLEQIGWKWPYIVKYVHCYSFVFLGVLCYSAHFTSLFFHHPYESFMGLLVGLLGLYLPFWILISCGCLPLDRFGILRGGRCGRMN